MFVRLLIEHPQALLFVHNGIPENILAFVFSWYFAQNRRMLLVSLYIDFPMFNNIIFVTTLYLYRLLIVILHVEHPPGL